MSVLHPYADLLYLERGGSELTPKFLSNRKLGTAEYPVSSSKQGAKCPD